MGWFECDSGQGRDIHVCHEHYTLKRVLNRFSLDWDEYDFTGFWLKLKMRSTISSWSCPLTGDTESSVCICRSVVNCVSTMAVSQVHY